MNIKNHTRNQKRMYRIHKQEEKIMEQELMIGSLKQEIERLNNIINKFENKGYDIAQERADFLLEIERLNNIINKARRKLGEYKHYSTPTKEQNKENEDISEEVYQILHENLYEIKELKENNK